MDKTKSHPDYETGYADALNGRAREQSSAPYLAGWDAGKFARDAFARAGFTQDAEDTFSVALGGLRGEE